MPSSEEEEPEAMIEAPKGDYWKSFVNKGVLIKLMAKEILSKCRIDTPNFSLPSY